MIKFFRKIRQKLLQQNKVTQYLAYALGEIFLVVIGILIALQLNNWNENRNKQKKLDAIYTIIEKDLKTDLDKVLTTIAYYEKLDTILYKILTNESSDSIINATNETNYLNCTLCRSNINKYEAFEFQDNGLQLLKTYLDNQSIDDVQFSQEIILFYASHKLRLTSILEFISNEAYNNLKYFEQFPWYSDYYLERYNSEAIKFFLQNQMYRNKVANYRVWIGRNYIRNMKQYMEDAKIMLTKIDKRRNVTQLKDFPND